MAAARAARLVLAEVPVGGAGDHEPGYLAREPVGDDRGDTGSAPIRYTDSPAAGRHAGDVDHQVDPGDPVGQAGAERRGAPRSGVDRRRPPCTPGRRSAAAQVASASS